MLCHMTTSPPSPIRSLHPLRWACIVAAVILLATGCGSTASGAGSTVSASPTATESLDPSAPAAAAPTRAAPSTAATSAGDATQGSAPTGASTPSAAGADTSASSIRNRLSAVSSTLDAADAATQQAQDALDHDQEGNP